MHLVNNLSAHEIEKRLESGNFHLHVGPYIYTIRSNLSRIATGIERLYGDFPLADAQAFSDYNIALTQTGLLSRWRGQAQFSFDHQSPFEPIPTLQAYAFMEWGMNWCVSIHANEYLKLHAAVVARGDTAIIMPGVPGAGKSTLCAALGLNGWRILSDEHALIPPGTAEVVPLCRPVSLKNESIALIESFSQNAVLGPVSEETHKGVVAHMKADLAPDSHDERSLPARIMLFPRYSTEEQQQLRPRLRTQSFILAAYHSFNYSLMGEAGFRAMKTLIDSVDCYDLIYHDLEWALKTVGDLHDWTCAQ